jgi:hypothetical protein
MARAKMTLQELAVETVKVDPERRGISYQAIAFVATDKRWARESTTTRSADLIEDALSVPRGSLFVRTTIRQPSEADPSWADL